MLMHSSHVVTKSPSLKTPNFRSPPAWLFSHFSESGVTREDWAVIWGGAKRMGGMTTYQRTRSPENFWTPPKELLVCSVGGFLYWKTRALTPEGVENVLYEGGCKTLFGRGVIREVFHSPLFSTPPWRPPRRDSCPLIHDLQARP